MFKKTKKGYYLSKKLNQLPGTVHGFSTRHYGDCNPARGSQNQRNIEQFLKDLGLKRANLVLMEQVHGNKVKVVTGADKGKIIPGVDGLVTTKKDLVLGVKAADCLQLLYYEPTAQVIGVAHAGWQGVLKKIPQKVIEVMIRLGALPEEILVAIGPHIGSCCYEVEKNRAEKFKKKFGEGKLFLDLVAPTLRQLVHTGVPEGNIDIAKKCTSCENKEFFSFRKDTKKSYGAMLAVISLVK